MNTTYRLIGFEFRYRIFVSLGIVLFACISAYGLSSDHRTIVEHIVGPGGRTAGFLVAAGLCMLATLLRMSAGTVLRSQRVMSFGVRPEHLSVAPPYDLVRNPIYLSDLIAAAGFAVCMPPLGLVYPALLTLHYRNLISWEERSLGERHNEQYAAFSSTTPRLLPTWSSVRRSIGSWRQLRIDADGARYNALYLLFIPGLSISAFTGEFFHAVLFGLPALADWAYWHTVKGLSPETSEVPRPRGVFSGVLYAQCWEDPEIDRAAFRIGPSDSVFTITSGGCNALTFLLDDPASVVALDLNPHQNHLLELKMAAIRLLSYDDLLRFFGVMESGNRLEMYAGLRSLLSEAAREFWDERRRDIERGILHCGRFERYMRILGWITRKLVGREVVEHMFRTHSAAARSELYLARWETPGWRIFTRVFLSRRAMSWFFDKAFFAQLDQNFSFGDHFRDVVRRAVTNLTPADSPFLSYALLGRYYDLHHLPPYLRRENIDRIRQRLDRITIISGDCGSWFATQSSDSISCFNFTNIFEWMPVGAFEGLLRETWRVARDGAVLTYRNLLVPRRHPACLEPQFAGRDEEAQLLHEQDRSFLYRSYVVEVVNKRGVTCASKCAA